MSNQAKKLTIEQIQNKFFEIPTYQRLYEWEKEQIETLLDDMKKAWKPDILQSSESNTDSQKSSKQYFIGNITTSIDKNDSNKFILIDGQQRLTTLWFIGFYLASKDCKIWKNFISQDDKLRIAMPIRDNEEKALRELVNNIEGKENLAQLLQGNNIHQKIINAFECIEKWFNTMFGKYTNGKLEIDDLKRLKCFSLFIYRRVCFVFVELAQNTDLNRFFVRMNNRGKQLEKHEILKARILHKISEKEREKYAEIWDLCSDMNRYIFQSKDSEIYEVESIIDFPTFLLHCFKIFMVDNLPKNFTISKDKLLEFIDIEKLTWEDKNCKEFIETMLRYRVLFDGFVIKFTAKKGKETNEKESPYKIKRLGSDDNLVNSKLDDLEMIQNYLRVARSGDRQNYRHWLTPFLEFLHKSELINYDYIKPETWNPDEICKTFAKNDEGTQDDLVKFLETLDTNLANTQLSDNELLDKTNEAIQQAQNLQPTKIPADVDLDSLLNNGTNTQHYWFYRLEYYLWKWGKHNQTKLAEIENKFGIKIYNAKLGESKNETKFSDIFTKNLFHFRMLGSIEHFSAIQRKEARKKEWNFDIFGNLALISQNFNSSLSNQLEKIKKDEVIKQLKRGRLESLKYFIMCANLNDDEWTYDNAQAHQKQMLNILIESLGLNQKDSQNSSDSKAK